MPEPYMTLKQIAEYLGISERTVSRWIAEVDFPHYRVRGRLRFRASEVDEWMRRYWKIGDTENDQREADEGK